MPNSLSVRDQRRNLLANCIHEGSWGFAIAFHNVYAVIPLFLSMLNAPQAVIISVAGLLSILMAIPQLFSAVLGRNISNIRIAVIGVHILVLPPIFLAGFVFAFIAPTGPSAWLFYYICFILYGLAIGMVIPIWVGFLDHVSNQDRRGRFLGISFAMNSVFGFTGGLVSRWLLASSIEFPRNFGWGFLFTFGAFVVGTAAFLLYRVKEPAERQPHKTVREFWNDTINIIRTHANFRSYILSRIFFTANFPAMSLYAIYAHEKFGFQISEAGIFTAITTAAFAFASYGAGRLGDRWGHKKTITISISLHLLALIMALAAKNMLGVYAVFLFLGAGQGSFFPTSMSLVYRFAGKRDNKTYIALIDTSLAPFTFISIIIASSLSHFIGISFTLIGIGISITISIFLLLTIVKEPTPVQL